MTRSPCSSCLIAAPPGPGDRFGERAELLARCLCLMLGGGDRVAHAVKLSVRLLCLLAKGLGLLPGCLGFARGLGELSLCGARMGLGLGSFIFKRFQPAPLDEPCPGRRSPHQT